MWGRQDWGNAMTISAAADFEAEEVLVELRSISRAYQVGTELVWAARSVSLRIEAGEFLAVVGPSGSGKSTLLHLMAGLDRPTDGEVYARGRCLAGMTDGEMSEFRRRQVGLVFQAFNLVPVLSALENVALPAAISGWSRSRQTERAGQLLDGVGLAAKADHLPSQLSGGEQQRVAIARALMMSPSLILADEPTGNLDSDSSAAVVSQLSRLHRQGMAVVMVTHDLEVASAAERIVWLRDGIVSEPPARARRSLPRQTGRSASRATAKS